MIVTSYIGGTGKVTAWVLIFMALASCSQHKYPGLMSWEEYNSTPRSRPYVLKLVGDRGDLLYYGAFHCVDLSHPQFSDIEQKWAAFRPTLALSEGSLWPLEASREEAIRKYGEQGLLRFLAARDGVPMKCLDQPRLLQSQHLRRHFSVQEVKVYMVLRQARVNQLLGRNPNDVADIESFLGVMEKFRLFRFPPHSLTNLEAIVKHEFPELEDWRTISEDYFYNKEKGKFLSEIHRYLMRYRDNFMLGILFNELKKGRRIFAVVGRSHVAMQEPALRAEVARKRE
jgi:hypothetical protein